MVQNNFNNNNNSCIPITTVPESGYIYIYIYISIWIVLMTSLRMYDALCLVHVEHSVESNTNNA